MTPEEIKRLRVKTEITRSYYVQDGDWIYAGPYDTKEEAQQALDNASLELANEGKSTDD